MSLMLAGIPAPPLDTTGLEFYNWLGQVFRLLTESGAIAWVRVDKTGSSLGDLTTRRHDQLTELSDNDHPQYPLKASLETVSGAWIFSAAFTHTGTTVGFYSKAPVTQAAASADLTGNAAGTTDGAIQTLTDPADAPATADALRDDLVANLIPELRNNIDELRIKVNNALTALRGVGVIAT